MNHLPSAFGNTENPRPRPPREVLREIVDDCLRRQARGEQPDFEAIEAAHPELMPDLAQALSGLRAIADAWQRTGSSTSKGLESDVTGCLHVRCPNCQTPVQCLAETMGECLECPHCSAVIDLAAHFPDTDIKEIGHFELCSPLGEGSFGRIWKSYDRLLHRYVAIKIPHRNFENLHGTSFLREAQAAARLRHPSIVAVHEVGRIDDRIYIVSDYIDGVSLKEWLRHARMTGREAADFCRKVADGLEHAHQVGIIHRDLKPANILIDTTQEPHITDFGLARFVEADATVTASGEILGTPAYMSPEQARGDSHRADGRSDIYSLGIILYELLTGQIPFRGDSHALLGQVLAADAPDPRSLNAEIPPDLAAVCLKSMERNAARRYASAAALRDDLRRFLSGQRVQARNRYRLSRFWRSCHRLGRSALAVLAIGVLALLGLVMWIVEPRQSSQRKREAERSLTGESDTQHRPPIDALGENSGAADNSPLGVRASNDVVQLLTAREHFKRGDLAQAFADYSHLIESNPQMCEAWMERGRLLFGSGLFHQAARDYARGYELGESIDETHWINHVTSQVWEGDLDEYRRACGLALTWRNTGTPLNEYKLLTIVLLSPAFEDDQNLLVEWAQGLAIGEPPFQALRQRLIAAAHYRAGRFEEAIAASLVSPVTNAHATPPADTCPVLAMACYRLNRLHEAQEALQRALDQYTAELDILSESIGEAGTFSFNLLEMMIYLREACALMGNTLDQRDQLHLLQARSLAKLHLKSAALDVYALAEKLDPRSRYISLEAALLRDLSPRDFLAKRRQVAVLLKQAQCAKAAANWRKRFQLLTSAIAADPSSAASYQERGELFAQLGLVDHSARDFSQSLSLRRPRSASQGYQQALIFVTEGDFDAYRLLCRDLLDQFLDRNGPKSRLEVLRAITLSPNAECDWSRMVDLGQQIVARYRADRHRDLGSALRTLGKAYYRAGEFAKAVAMCEESQQSALDARAASPNEESLAVIAMAYHQLGRPDAARAALNSCGIGFQPVMNSAEFPNDQTINNLLATIDDVPVSFDAYERSIWFREATTLLVGPPSPDFRWHLVRARALALIGKYDASMEEYQVAVRLNPCDPVILAEYERIREMHTKGSKHE